MNGPGVLRWGAMATALVPAATVAETFRVPSDYPTIQAGLDQASLGDTVLVGPGTYSDWTIFNLASVVAVIPDGVVLVSEDGPAETVIDLGPLDGVGSSSGAFVHFGHASGQTVIDGFRVAGFHPLSVGISGSYSELIEIRNCVFEVTEEPDPDTYSKGITGFLSNLRVTDCTFIRCSGPSGAGITHTGGALVVESCTFVECFSQAIRATNAGGGVVHTLEVRDCVFQRVAGSVSGGCIQSVNMDHGALIEACVFEEPGAIGSAGAAMAVSGTGHKNIFNNLFHNMNLTNGSSCIFLLEGSASVVGNTFAELHQPSDEGLAIKAVNLDTIQFDQNIVAHTSGAIALSFESGVIVTSDCNVFWDNEDGIGYPLDPTDRIADPQFCDPDNRDYTLQATSPCLPPYSLGCGLIGALGEGCGTVSVESESWAKVKAAFRDTSRDGREDGKE